MTAGSYLAAGPVVRRVRGYFAPVNRAGSVPAVFDAAEMGGFSLEAPPAPWVSLGWIADFARVAGSRTAPVLTGVPAGVLEQVRESVEAQVSLRFLSWTKLTMALATGSQHMNLLVAAGGAAAAGDGGTGAGASVREAGATATLLPMAAADAARFMAGQLLAVDVDYAGQVGFVGSPVSAAYVKAGAVTDVDYVRRVTFNVARVASVSTAGLTLAEALPGGAPMAGMKASAAVGFVDREGGSFFQEWSALFVLEGAEGERVFFYYPRLQALGGAVETAKPINVKAGGTLERVMLAGSFRALPVVDSLDGERVVCYRSFLPAAGALAVG
jgi:hypothetical protein